MKSVRRLACILAGFGLSIAIAHFILPAACLIYAAGASAFVFVLAFTLKGNARRRALLFAFGLIIGFLCYKLHYDSTVSRCAALDGKTVSVTAEIAELPNKASYGQSVKVKLLGDNAPHVCATLYTNGDELKNAELGDIISAKVKLRDASRRYGEDSDSLISKGIYLTGNVEKLYSTMHGADFNLRYLPQYIGNALRAQIRAVFSDDDRAFMLALLTGDRSEYYADCAMQSSMSTAGLAHVIAVSGMHVSFLVGFVQLILGRNRRTNTVCLLLVWLFVLMSGASPSAIRAGLMLTVFLIAPLFDHEPDRLTALLLALGIILALNPFSIGSISLQMSFAAIAGLYIFAKPVYDYLSAHLAGGRRLRNLRHYIIGALSSSISVTVFTAPLLSLHFGYISLFMPVTNILCLWAVSLLFVGGYIACFAGFIIKPLAIYTAWLLSYLVRYIKLVTAFIAHLPYSAIYTENLYAAAWVAFSYLTFALCYLKRGKGKRFKPLFPTLVCVAALISVIVWTQVGVANDTGTFGVMDVGSAQCLALTQNKSCVVIDCGSKNKAVNAGSEVSNYLHASGRQQVDCLILTHLHSDHANGAAMLLNKMRVKTLILPAESEHDALYSEIMREAERNGTEIKFISSDENIAFGDIAVKLYAPFERGDKNERGLMISARLGTKDILITGDASKATEKKLVFREELSDTDILIVGHHGSKNSTSELLLKEADPDIAVISVGYNSYGHPSEEVLDRLNEYEISFFRTDISGRIIIKTR